jgi:hypothetical protein
MPSVYLALLTVDRRPLGGHDAAAQPRARTRARGRLLLLVAAGAPACARGQRRLIGSHGRNQPTGPKLRCRTAGERRRLLAGACARGRRRLISGQRGRPMRAPQPPVRHDARSPRRPRPQHARQAQQRTLRRRHDGRNLRQQLHRCHHQVRRAVLPRLAQPIPNAPIREPRQRHRPPRRVAQQVLEPGAVIGADHHPRMHVEPAHLGAPRTLLLRPEPRLTRLRLLRRSLLLLHAQELAGEQRRLHARLHRRQRRRLVRAVLRLALIDQPAPP